MTSPSRLAACLFALHLVGCKPLLVDVPFSIKPPDVIVEETGTRPVEFAWLEPVSGVVDHYILTVSGAGTSKVRTSRTESVTVELERGVTYGASVRTVDAVGRQSVDSNRIEVTP